MTTINQTSHVNVEYTLNNWLATDLAALSRPSWLPNAPPLVFDAPDIESSLPCFSVAHLPLEGTDEFLGRQVGGGGQGLIRHALLEVSAWVSRADPNWIAQLRTMEDMLATMVAATSSKLIKDFAANPSSPTVTAYKVNLQGVQRLRASLQSASEPAGVEVGANPDLRGRRLFVGYWWVYRA